jgi:hypothetical protein
MKDSLETVSVRRWNLLEHVAGYVVVGIVVFVAGSLGLALHRVVPEKHLTGGSKDMIGAVAGLLTLLSALVLWPPHLVRLWRVCGPARARRLLANAGNARDRRGAGAAGAFGAGPVRPLRGPPQPTASRPPSQPTLEGSAIVYSLP